MIDWLNGSCLAADEGHVVIDVQGVGYGLEGTKSLIDRLTIGDSARIWIHTHVREDQITLFGFNDQNERRIFRLLIGINRIGPKVAMGVLSTLSLGEIVEATIQDDPKIFARVPKIGTAQAKKMILELRPKLEKLPLSGVVSSGPSQLLTVEGAVTSNSLAIGIQEDLKSALMNLGYKERESSRIVLKLSRNPASDKLPELIRAALQELGGVGAGQEDSSLDALF